MKVTLVPTVISKFNTATKGTGTGGFGNKMTNGNNPNYSIVEIGQKIPEDLKRLSLRHQWKTIS